MLQDSPQYKALRTAFERNAVFPHLHTYDLFRNWLQAVWAFCEAPWKPDEFREALDRYTAAEGAEFARIMGLYTDAVEAFPFEDILGPLFMELDVKSVRAGQYFTPWPIAEMMARMSFDQADFEQKAAEKGEVTVCDPAVGSGVMLLAFAKVVHEALGWKGISRLKLYGQDIDERCVLMCRIQIRFNGLDHFGRIIRLSTMAAALGTPEAPPAEPDPVPPAPEPPPIRIAALADRRGQLEFVW